MKTTAQLVAIVTDNRRLATPAQQSAFEAAIFELEGRRDPSALDGLMLAMDESGG